MTGQYSGCPGLLFYKQIHTYFVSVARTKIKAMLKDILRSAHPFSAYERDTVSLQANLSSPPDDVSNDSLKVCRVVFGSLEPHRRSKSLVE